MAKSKSYERWAIIGESGLYVDQRLTRIDAIANHVADLYDVGRWVSGCLTDEQRQAWTKCKANGDRAVKVRIIVPVGQAQLSGSE